MPVPPPPDRAAEVFGDRLVLTRRYAELLAGSGVRQGLLGPREVPRLWERHLLNCAVIESLLPHGTRLVDVGSGAGLPGLALALARPDLQVVLVEPMLRRTAWLEATIADLALPNVTVLRGRAQELSGRLLAPVVTARAVARLADLAAWCLPLVSPGGRLLALKGESAEQELAEDLPTITGLGAGPCRVITLEGAAGADPSTVPTRVVEILAPAPMSRGGRARGDARRRPGRRHPA